MASGAARSASIAERESVATGICVGDWDVSGRGGMRCPRLFSVARHSALYEHASLPAAARWASTGDHFSLWSRIIVQRIQMRVQRGMKNRLSIIQNRNLL
ncbi:hypothetical protein TcCL_ESM09242 [Trypanosoma cruzi]|nr:hypothetical protein TcCL_ESM09242 [Trypanosoma cruzi]